MSAYIFLNNIDRRVMRSVRSSNAINELLKEALEFSPTILISEYTKVRYKGIFRKKILDTHYTVYHESPAHDGSAYQAKVQISAYCTSGKNLSLITNCIL